MSERPATPAAPAAPMSSAMTMPWSRLTVFFHAMGTPTHHPVDWMEIADDFREGILLGNGASIAVGAGFDYGSLHQAAAEQGLISADVQAVFEHLGTSDFEFVLRILWHAHRVNEVLGIRDDRTAAAYASVKAALIDVVRSVHPQLAAVEPLLGNAAHFLERFQTVASLSYDVLVYWTMMIANRAAPNRFKDCWIDGLFKFDWEELREPFGSNPASTLVFYPHGNLLIGSDISGSERKVAAGSAATLLETITTSWDTGRLTPVFVSEGTSADKRTAIRRSPYLSSVFGEVLPNLGKSIVLHGWSLSDDDDHILWAICRGHPRRIAVSVDPNSIERAQYCGIVQTKLQSRLGDRFELIFYDRNSAGCWVTP